MDIVKSRIYLCSLLVLLMSMLVFAGCSSKLPSFSIKGTIMCGETVISGAVVKTDTGLEVTTGEDGVFEFADLKSAVTLSFEAEGYAFETARVVVYKETKNLVIKAEQVYNLTGRVVSNDVGVPNASVSVSGAVISDKTATTDSNGYFTVNNVAGEISVKVEKSGYVFETKTASIENSNLTFSGTTNITAVVKKSDGTVLHGVSVSVGAVLMEYYNGSFRINNIALGSVVTPSMAGYHFEPATVSVSKENQQIEFVAYEIYSISGKMVSGSTPISGVSIKLNGDVVATSASDGSWSVVNLWGKNFFTFSHSLYKFNNTSVEGAGEVEVNGTFTLRGTIKDEFTFAGLEFVSVNCGNANVYTDANGSFTITGASLGEELTFSKQGYNIASRTISNTLQMNIFATPYFNAKIKVLCDGEPLAGASVSVGNNILTTNDEGEVVYSQILQGFDASVTMNGYTSGSVTISRENNEQTISLNKYFGISLTATSGTAILGTNVGAKVNINGIDYDLDENGAFVLPTQIYQPVDVVVSATGYNSATLRADKNNTTLVFDLDYTITGFVSNGELSVEAEIVDVTDSDNPVVLTTTNSSGAYSVNLKDTHTIIAVADGLTFESVVVSSQATENFNATYSISGTLSSNNESVEGLEVSLFKGETEQKYVVGADGKYAFENLSGGYTLAVVSSSSLYPTSYSVTKGGDNYNFSANGYAVSGYVYCNGVGIAGVKVVAGDYSAYTRNDGKYEFDFIMGEQTLTASKDGYAFAESYPIAFENNEQEFNFTATYSVSGTIMSGTTAIEGVLVTIGEGDEATTQSTDASGYFVIAGLKGTLPITFAKEGYAFSGASYVTQPVNLSVTASFAVSGVVKTGNEVLANISVTNGIVSATTNENGEFVLNGVVAGDTISASSAGYTFNTAIATFGSNVTISGTFNLSGVVRVAGEIKDGVTVKLLNKESQVIETTTTANGGKYAFSNLSEFGSLVFELAGYEFAPVIIAGPSNNAQISAIFNVTGSVLMETTASPLADVVVKLNGKEYRTNAQGHFEITGLSTNGVLQFEKVGYEFSSAMVEFAGATNVEITATYFVTVKVSSGSIELDGVEVKCADAQTIHTEDEVNTFTVRGLTGTHTIIASASGYNDGSISVSAPTTGDIVLTYDVQINISGASTSAKLNNIKIVWSDESDAGTRSVTYTEEISQITLQNVVGKGTWKLTRDEYRFTPEQGSFYSSANNSFSTLFAKVYTLNGKVATAGGIGVAGMLVEAKDEKNKTLATTYTASDGSYNLTNLIGNVIVNAGLSVKVTGGSDTSYTGITSTQAAGETTGTLNISISNQDYAYWLFQNGYQAIREATSYFNHTTGSVNATTMGMDIPQTVNSYRKKDSTGKYVSENKNYGTKMQDTCVALTAYYDSKLGSTVNYKMLTGSGNVNSDATVKDYSVASWSNASLSSFKGTFGSDPTDLYIYNYQRSDFSGATLGKSGNNITLNLSITNPTEALMGNYRKQMENLSGMSDITYKSVNATYTFVYKEKDVAGNTIGYYMLSKLDLVEKYEVVAYGFTAATTATTTETYNIGGANDYLISKSDYE